MRGRRLPHVLTRPEQGWSSLLLLLGMLVLLGVSVADSRPLELAGQGSLSASLPVIMVAAGLIGLLLARSSLGVVRAHFVGAAVAATVLLLVTGAALLERSPLPTDVAGIGERISQVWMQLDTDIGRLIADEIQTSTITVYLVLGALSWTTAQFGAFSVFRYDRGGPAVMAVGTILFLNLGLPVQIPEEQLPVVPILAIFAALALLLLMRLQLMQQRFAWARRHISDTRDVSRLFLRTGVAFVLIAVVSASSLTVWATVEAQEVDIQALEEPLEDLVERVSDLLRFVGIPVDQEVASPLGSETPLRSKWEPGEGTAFVAEVGTSLYGNYWWGKADDRYDPERNRWVTTAGDQEEVERNGPLQPSRVATAGGRLEVPVLLTIGDSRYARYNLFRPPEAVSSMSHTLLVRETPGGGVSDIEYPEPLREGDRVSYRSQVRDYDPGNYSLTGNRLRATADEEYPEWVLARYLQGKDDRRIVGERTLEMAADIRGGPRTTPYDWAVRVQAELRDMDYNTDIDGLCEPYGGVLTECLLAIEEGFCQQYATTMVMLMRAMGVPARFVTGYLRGELDEQGRWVVEQEALHNWVEVYFPTVGWVRFDPTPGLEDFGQVPTELEDGEGPDGPIETPPGPERSEPPIEPETPEPTLPPPTGPDDPTEGSGSDGLTVFISLGALAALLATVVSVLLLFRLRRLPAGDDSLAYRGIVSLATRLGYGPHPSQTEYEYASSLSETIPSVREDLFVVTGAQVQTTYGERELADEHRGRLRASYARIRTALLRLSLRWRR